MDDWNTDPAFILREFIRQQNETPVEDDYPVDSIAAVLRELDIKLHEMVHGDWDFGQFEQEPIGIDELI